VSVEFIETKNINQIEEFVARVENSPEWNTVLLLRESIKRLTFIRGRLMGENPQDKKDLYYDINSYRRISLDHREIDGALTVMVGLETSYYKYAENYAAWCAVDSGYPERIPDYKDIAKELVAWDIWCRWEPGAGISPNGLHRKIMGTLKYLPLAIHKSYLSTTPISGFFPGIEDRGEVVNFSDKIREMPEYRLRRSLARYALEGVFARLGDLPVRERLAILSVMGYIPGVKNITQGINLFGIETETFRNAFDRGLDLISKLDTQEFSDRSAYEIVEEALGAGLIRDANGKMAYFDSPRLVLLTLKPSAYLRGLNLEIFNMARKMNGNTFRYSLDEMAKEFGLSKTAVAKRIRRISDFLEANDT
jgi:hypothetical protein